MIRYENERFTIFEKDSKLIGQEKEHEILKKDKFVLIQELAKGEKLEKSVSDAFDKLKAGDVIKKGDNVAIKVNIGGGIDYVPTTYSNPLICEAIIKKVRKLGGKPFVCEANMRARIIHDRLLKTRGYLDMLKRNGCKFVNLSNYSTVEMNCLNLDVPLKLPEILLKPNVKIISFAPPKHHWECGISCNQKNMYGAIAEYRKSIYHRKYERIDKAVAAAARIMSPDINILAGLDLGTGVGPHFVFPVKGFNRMIISKDMIRGDKVASEILGYPFHLVKYAMINTKGKDVDYILHPDSRWPSEEILKQIKTDSLDYGGVNFWKATLWLQYFLPHALQIKMFPPMEIIFTWVNREFYDNPM